MERNITLQQTRFSFISSGLVWDRNRLICVLSLKYSNNQKQELVYKSGIGLESFHVMLMSLVWDHTLKTSSLSV